MVKAYTRYGVLATLVVAPLLLAGCTQTEEMTTIQTTANAAKAEADRAMSTAEQALQTAQAADAKATKAEADAQAANEKVDRMFQRHLRK
jgi:outer membrane murein-binding lipoprotein Lpp